MALQKIRRLDEGRIVSTSWPVPEPVYSSPKKTKEPVIPLSVGPYVHTFKSAFRNSSSVKESKSISKKMRDHSKKL